MHRFLLTVAAALFCLPVSGQTSLDQQHMAQASQRLNNGDCNAARTQLSMVSDVGQREPAYTLAKARMWECMHNYDSASALYTRYLATTDDTAVKAHAAGLAHADQQHINTAYKDAAGIRSFDLCVRRSYTELAFGMAACPLTQAMFRTTVSVASSRYHFIEKSNFMTRLTLGYDLYMAPNIQMLSALVRFDTSRNNKPHAGAGYGMHFDFAVPYLLRNNKESALSVIPMLGVEAVRVPSVRSANDNGGADIDPYVSMYAGIGGSLLLRHHVSFSIAFRHYFATHLSAENMTGDKYDVPVHFDNFLCSIAYRYERNRTHNFVHTIYN